jgi:hypothetical protein
LRARRAGGLAVEGRAAACVNCHQRSGLGSVEGPVLVPPIIGPYLFRDRATNVTDLSLPHLPGFVPNEHAYDEASFAQALRTGGAPGGRTLGALMPRYVLDDASMQLLGNYLRSLSAGPMPGVSDTELQLATVLAPDTAAADRAVVVEVLEKYLAYRNERIAARVLPGGPAAQGQYRVNRRWGLQVWQLEGPPATWQQQLHAHQQLHPVFAVLSGLGGANWAPVHRFCEQEHVPCLLPNVDLPVVAEQDFYPVYYSKGVLLEAGLMASALLDQGLGSATRVVQVYREGDIGAQSAAALDQALARPAPATVHRVLGRSSLDGGLAADARAGELDAALQGIGNQDMLVLWLRPQDLAVLAAQPPAPFVLVSGLMAGLEAAPLAPAWKQVARMSYPLDLPDLRRVRMNFPHAWLRARGIAAVDDRLQSTTWLSCMILDDAMDSMLDSFVPDFLVERFELMLGTRLSSAYFPRLALAGGQRFASKGGYVVRFAGAGQRHVVAEGGWRVP